MAEEQYYFDKLDNKRKEEIVKPFVETLDLLVNRMLEQNISPKEFLALYIMALPSKEDFVKAAENKHEK